MLYNIKQNMKFFDFFKKQSKTINIKESRHNVEKSNSKIKTNWNNNIKSDFEYVHVEEDGSVRELTREEKGYLKEEFAPSDGARPYIKFRYSSKTPDGKLWGFLARKKVPKDIDIKKTEDNKENWRRNWILIIKDLNDLKIQKKTWLGSKNPYYSFTEFMCSYFDDLDLSDGYEKHIINGYLSNIEYGVISNWHNMLSEYESPGNDDYNDKAILDDKKWTEIIKVGKKSIRNLKPNLTKYERGLFI